MTSVQVPSLPPDIKAALQRGASLHQSGQIAAAAKIYGEILKRDPRNAQAHNLLGVALSQMGQHGPALQHMKEALALKPRLEAFRHNYAQVLLSAGRFEDAARLYRELTREFPLNEVAAVGLVRSLLVAEKVDEAIAFLETASKKHSNSAAFLNERGRAASAKKVPKLAIADYRRALQLNPRFTSAAVNLATALSEEGEVDEALRILEGLNASEPRNVDVIKNLGNLYRAAWNSAKGLEIARRGLELLPGHPVVQTLEGLCLIDLGRNDEGEAALRSVIDRGADVLDAVIGLSQISKFAPDSTEWTIVNRVLAQKNVPEDNLKTLHYIKAKMLDDNGRHGEAVAAATEAKKFTPPPAETERHASYTHAAMSAMGREFFEKRRHLGDPTEQPVFILGMPRSGTTLAEQIIASHAQADGAGEMKALTDLARPLYWLEPSSVAGLQRVANLDKADIKALSDSYLKALREGRKPDALRITDKMPQNFQHIWLIALMFPNARIIHCNRNPVDVCISIYLRNFSWGHWYTSDFVTLGKYYKLYQEAVAHWKSVCGLRWYENDYEALVADPEPNIRAMIDFLGLPWDDNCLSHTATERSVVTFSKWQVRQPIYQTSVERWRKYAPYIKPLLDELGIEA
jgi:tetratricopeptide (TPR) repeat protein